MGLKKRIGIGKRSWVFGLEKIFFGRGEEKRRNGLTGREWKEKQRKGKIGNFSMLTEKNPLSSKERESNKTNWTR